MKMKLGKNDKKTRVRKLQCVIFYFYKYIHFERFKNPTSRKENFKDTVFVEFPSQLTIYHSSIVKVRSY